MSDPLYYIATGEARDLILNFNEQRRKATAAYRAFAEELGATEWDFHGKFAFPEDAQVPAGLRVFNRFKNIYQPDLRTKAGRALADKAKALPMVPDQSDLTLALCCSSTANLWDGFRFGYRIFTVPDCVVILTREGREPPSAPTCTPLAASEYWRMVESNQTEKE